MENCCFRVKQSGIETIPAGGMATVVVEMKVFHEGAFEGSVPIYVFDRAYRELLVNVRGRGINAKTNGSL